MSAAPAGGRFTGTAVLLRKPVIRYVLALLAVALASGLTRAVWPVFSATPFLPFFAAVMAVTYVAGRGPGLVAIVTSGVAYLAVMPADLHPVGPVIPVAAYVLVAGAVSLTLARWLETEAALGESERRLRTVMANAPLLLFAFDRDGVIRLADGRGFDQMGAAAATLAGRPLSALWPGPGTADGLQRALAGESQAAELPAAGRLFDVRVVPLRDARGEVAGALGVAIDVTERHTLSERLQQSQQMEAVGRLAAGVAHDFNNMLMAILGYADILLMGLAEEDPRRQDVEEIRTAGKRAANLTRQLLVFGRRQPLQPRTIDPNALLDGMRDVIRRLVGEEVELAMRLGPGVRSVKADPGQLEQAIMSLAAHAREAMPEGGRLTIDTANVELDERTAAERRLSAGPAVAIHVADSGSGLSPEEQARVFEPFFTTREQGHGTGLGLATVYGAIEQNGGRIGVASETGRGTTFTILLPASRERAGGETAAAPHAAASGGRETILLVEDEDAVRVLAREILRRQGYAVLEAANGDEALRLAGAGAEGFDLLVTDVVMPGPNGPEVAAALRSRRPDLKVLYITGYADQAVMRGQIGQSDVLLHKPFAAATLLRWVRHVLDAPATQATRE